MAKIDWKLCNHLVRKNGINGRLSYGYITWENGRQEIADANLAEYRMNYVCFVTPMVQQSTLCMYLFKNAIRIEKEVRQLQEKVTRIDYDLYHNPSNQQIKEKYEQCCKIASNMYDVIENYQSQSDKWLGDHFITGLFEYIRMYVMEIPLEIPEYRIS